MKHSSASDKNFRKCIQQQETRAKFFRFLRSNFFLDPVVRACVANNLFFLKPISRVHNYCAVSFRSKGIVREFKLSRLEFKRMVGLRLISGVKRSSY